MPTGGNNVDDDVQSHSGSWRPLDDLSMTSAGTAINDSIKKSIESEVKNWKEQQEKNENIMNEIENQNERFESMLERQNATFGSLIQNVMSKLESMETEIEGIEHVRGKLGAMERKVEKYNDSQLTSQRQLSKSIGRIMGQIDISDTVSTTSEQVGEEEVKNFIFKKPFDASNLNEKEEHVYRQVIKKDPQSSSLDRRFILRQVFSDVSKMEKGKRYSCEEEYHYGVEWFSKVKRSDNYLDAFLCCLGTETSEKWSIETDFEMKVIHPDGSISSKNKQCCFNSARGWVQSMDWHEMERNYSMNDQLIVECHVKIIKMTGVYGKSLRDFDESESLNFTLSIDTKKFHVEKEILSSNSPFFNSLLSEFPTQTEHNLSGMDSETFQKYLEVLHGEPDAINKTTVEGILWVAAKYDTPTVTEKCEDFLLDCWTMTSEKKQRMAMEYDLQHLKEECDNLLLQ